MKTVCVLKQIEGASNDFQLLPYGRIDIEGEEPAVMDEAGMGSIVEEFKRRGNDMVIDYEHQSLGGNQAPAAGWIKSLVDKGRQGLWAVVEWTEKAKQHLSNKEYRYFSPVMWLEKTTRRVVKIENVALTNSPKMNSLKPIMAKMTFDGSRKEEDERGGGCGIDPSDSVERGASDEGTAMKKLEKLIGKKMADDKTLSYGAALLKAQTENPDLAKEVVKEMMGLRCVSKSAQEQITAMQKLEQLVAKRMTDNKTLNYSDVLLEVQKENLELAREAARELSAMRR